MGNSCSGKQARENKRRKRDDKREHDEPFNESQGEGNVAVDCGTVRHIRDKCVHSERESEKVDKMNSAIGVPNKADEGIRVVKDRAKELAKEAEVKLLARQHAIEIATKKLSVDVLEQTECQHPEPSPINVDNFCLQNDSLVEEIGRSNADHLCGSDVNKLRQNELTVREKIEECGNHLNNDVIYISREETTADSKQSNYYVSESLEAQLDENRHEDVINKDEEVSVIHLRKKYDVEFDNDSMNAVLSMSAERANEENTKVNGQVMSSYSDCFSDETAGSNQETTISISTECQPISVDDQSDVISNDKTAQYMVESAIRVNSPDRRKSEEPSNVPYTEVSEDGEENEEQNLNDSVSEKILETSTLLVQEAIEIGLRIVSEEELKSLTVQSNTHMDLTIDADDQPSPANLPSAVSREQNNGLSGMEHDLREVNLFEVIHLADDNEPHVSVSGYDSSSQILLIDGTQREDVHMPKHDEQQGIINGNVFLTSSDGDLTDETLYRVATEVTENIVHEALRLANENGFISSSSTEYDIDSSSPDVIQTAESRSSTHDKKQTLSLDTTLSESPTSTPQSVTTSPLSTLVESPQVCNNGIESSPIISSTSDFSFSTKEAKELDVQESASSAYSEALI